MVFQCASCRVAITRPLLPLRPDQFLGLEMGQPAVPEGYFGVSTQDGTSPVLVNLADLVGTKHHPDRRRLAGCCGLDGCDGPNLVCADGHEVGTERSDCWTPHCAVLVQNVVSNPASFGPPGQSPQNG